MMAPAIGVSLAIFLIIAIVAYFVIRFATRRSDDSRIPVRKMTWVLAGLFVLYAVYVGESYMLTLSGVLFAVLIGFSIKQKRATR